MDQTGNVLSRPNSQVGCKRCQPLWVGFQPSPRPYKRIKIPRKFGGHPHSSSENEREDEGENWEGSKEWENEEVQGVDSMEAEAAFGNPSTSS